MTRREFYDYLLSQNCDQIPPSEFSKANVIGFNGPSGPVFLDTPIDDKEMKEAQICLAVVRLGIQPPPAFKDVQPVFDELAKIAPRFSSKEKLLDKARKSVN
jgi:hypothetical protein